MKVELAYPYTDADGKNHKADSTVDLPDDEARDLVHFGRARLSKSGSASKEK